jgi:hypothetical protein
LYSKPIEDIEKTWMWVNIDTAGRDQTPLSHPRYKTGLGGSARVSFFIEYLNMEKTQHVCQSPGKNTHHEELISKIKLKGIGLFISLYFSF